MKVYVLHWDNGQSYEDRNHGIEDIYLTKELAEQAKAICEDKLKKSLAPSYNEEGYDEHMFNAYIYESYTWRIQEIEVKESID